MNLSIRHWLREYYLEIPEFTGLSTGWLAGIAFRIVQDMKVKSLIPFDICTLAEVLELPLGTVWQEITVIAQLTTSLVRALDQNKPLKRNEGTWLAFQIAYLQGLQQVLDWEYNLQRPWLHQAMLGDALTRRHEDAKTQKHGGFFTNPVRLLQDTQLQGLLKTLRPGKLTDTQAEQALSLVADSLLVQQMNNATVAWFIANGVEEAEAKLITQRLENSLSGHLLAVIAENAPPLAQLQKFVGLGNSLLFSSADIDRELQTPAVDFRVGDKIDLYRERYRASLLQKQSEPLLMESFSFKDIYVPPQGLPVNESNSQSEQKTANSVDLMTWVRQQLADLKTITAIESEPGYGKTSFCQMWAATVAKELYPTWIPILIRLRDVKYGKSLAETLNSAFTGHCQINLADWLQQDYPRCLLLLDGLDELPPSHQGNRAKIIFMQQLLSLQSQSRHKIVLTSQSKALQEINEELPLPLRRIIIQPWDREEWRQWFQQWAKVQSLPIAQNFFTFLKQSGLFSATSKLSLLSDLVRQPLMLYLLGVLHRDGLLDDELLPLAANAQVKNNAALLWEIHNRLNRWLLGYPQVGGIKTMLLRSGSTHIHRTPDAIAHLLQGRHPQDVLAQMQVIALKILHSQRHQIDLPEEANNSTLPAFYFRSERGKISPHHRIEFSHPKLGKFLCAQAIVAQLKLLTQQQESVYGEMTFLVESPSNVAQHLYNLLGFGILSREIQELVIEGLEREPKQEFSFEMLCDRLLPFWYAYCRGRWLDEGIAHQALTHFQALQNPVNVEQVNAAVGLNVFLLLCACHQKTKFPFWPCGNPDNLAQFQPEALMTLIARTAVLDKAAFATHLHSTSLVSLNLSAAYLPQVMLAGANLEQVDLSNTQLIGSNLARVNLQQANLAGANLTGANLAGVNLQSANLTNACFFEAILSDINREIAAANGAVFSLQEFQAIKNLLSESSHINIFIPYSSESTAAWLDNTSGVTLVESAEGKPMLSAGLYEDYADDETILG
ncbi:MAG: pentapeptide repeat-containing protein [Fischerella sp.]|nr:pentapeptide repeat-containing protein [Fischerella sp.]